MIMRVTSAHPVAAVMRREQGRWCRACKISVDELRRLLKSNRAKLPPGIPSREAEIARLQAKYEGLFRKRKSLVGFGRKSKWIFECVETGERYVGIGSVNRALGAAVSSNSADNAAKRGTTWMGKHWRKILIKEGVCERPVNQPSAA